MNNKHHKNICVFLFQRKLCNQISWVFFYSHGEGEDQTMVGGGQGSQAPGGTESHTHPHPPS